MTSSPPPDENRHHYRIVVVSGGTSSPSATLMLAERIAERIARMTDSRGGHVVINTIDLRELAGEITTAVTSQLMGAGLTRAVELLGAADGIIASAPVYKAQASGLFTSFFHVLDNDLLIGKPVILAATAGTARHALVIDDQMRGLFAYLRTLTVPTSVFAAAEDWSSTELGRRIDRAAFELVLLLESGFARQIKEGSWDSYQHEYGSAGGTELDIDLGTDLMRLATGGSAGGSGSGRAADGASDAGSGSAASEGSATGGRSVAGGSGSGSAAGAGSAAGGSGSAAGCSGSGSAAGAGSAVDD